MFAAKLYLFLYAFPHAKGEIILLSCVRHGLEVSGIFAAPKVELKHPSSKGMIETLPTVRPVDPGQLAGRLGIPYHVVRHDDVKIIRSIVGHDAKHAVAIIGGARIIKKDVIDIFGHGIINYHPGKIPETSGLDSFYWMIKNNAGPGATAHYIDDRVDAGQLIEFERVSLNRYDTPATVKYKIRNAELTLNDRVLKSIVGGKLPSSTMIDRPKKNSPLSERDRRIALKNFPSWLSSQLSFQTPTGAQAS